ncbi:GNAT family N-acetyltransferase [Pseudaminobacter soli (ex Li et al. 2025)]|uniref:N-acetyltransferase domain-containing protein n=1 Tax=Pseudaminobacter soli (ex Li et al. 2025) TaxID=1295366 RepID=A0A2P7S1A8_9HYPH|nr:GNAT family N-acetyltransferase [Mesorhizobium soli]PSJ56241.1 hypothetical protein C7I85_24995 [Mesorhizobium soli]
MQVTLRSIAISEIPTLAGTDLFESDENFAGGSLLAIFNRLRSRPDLEAHHPFVVMDERQAVGFFMLREGTALPQWAHPRAISLHNFRINKQSRGRGYGVAGLVLASQWIAVHRFEIVKLMLSINVENASAYRLYLRCGFKEVGLSFEGRLGIETVLSCGVSELAAKHVPGQ